MTESLRKEPDNLKQEPLEAPLGLFKALKTAEPPAQTNSLYLRFHCIAGASIMLNRKDLHIRIETYNIITAGGVYHFH